MANEIEIRVTGADTSGPAVTSANRNAQSLRETVKTTGASMRDTAKAAEALAAEAGNVGDQAAEAARDTARLAEAADRAAKDAAQLDQQVDDLQTSLRDLASEYARTQDKDLLVKIKEQQAALREQTSVRKILRESAQAAAELAADAARVSTSAAVAARDTEKLGDAAARSARDAAQLDRQIEDLRGSLSDLASEYARTQDSTILTQIKQQQAALRETVNVRSMLPDPEPQGGAFGRLLGRVIGEKAGTEAAVGLSARLSASAASISPVGAAIAAPLAISIATLLGAAIGSAITGGVGVGGVVGGLKVAAQHAEVKASATSLADEFKNRMQSAAVAYVPAAIEGLDIIRGHMQAADDDFGRIFDSTARHVPKLADAVGQSARELLGGVADLAEESGPAVDSIADGLIRIGRAAGDGLSSLTDNADSGARALTVVFSVIEMSIQSVFRFINILAELYEVMEFGNGVLEFLSAKTTKGSESNTEFAQSIQDVIGGFRDETDAAEDAEEAIRRYAEATDRIVDQNLDAAEATLQYRDSLREAKDAIDKKRAVNDEESESLIRLARQSNSVTDALEQQGVSASTLATRHQQMRADFISTAISMGHSRARAEELADQYLKIPKKVSTDVEADTGQAARNLRSVRDLIAQIRSKRVVITAVTRSEGRAVPIGDGVGGRAHGGITGAAAGGIRGNLTWVGEQGPELLDLPPGTMVHPAGTSQRIAAESAGGTSMVIQGDVILQGVQDPAGMVAALQDYARWNGPLRIPVMSS